MSTDHSSGPPEGPRSQSVGGRRPASAPDFTRDRNAERKSQNDAWAASSLLFSGALVWGGAGYLVSEWLGSPLFTMVGLLIGVGTALYAVWFRYGRA